MAIDDEQRLREPEDPAAQSRASVEKATAWAARAKEHERSAEHFEQYAALLERHGAQHSANMERYLAQVERQAAEDIRGA